MSDTQFPASRNLATPSIPQDTQDALVAKDVIRPLHYQRQEQEIILSLAEQ